MLNYFNFKKTGNDEYLITNDFGFFSYINQQGLIDLIKDSNKLNEEKQDELQFKKFLINDAEAKVLEDEKRIYRRMKNYLFLGTSLHIFVLTNACNSNCIYCQAIKGDSIKEQYMDIDTAKRCVDFALQSPETRLTFEFQGGEPLLNFDVIKYIVNYTKEIAPNREIDYCLVSNFSLLTEEKLDFIIENNISISTSLDGHQKLHDQNRPLKNGDSSYDAVMNGIAECRKKNVNVGAIQTTTKHSLEQYQDMIDQYVNIGMSNIFIRPLTPLGMAKKQWEEIGYTSKQYISYYRNCLKYILELNLKGVNIVEAHASIFLKKIIDRLGVNYMELRSPCGAVYGQMAYYCDGKVYSCDEARMLAEMGNDIFRIGDVMKDTYVDVVNSNQCKSICSASVMESTPQCSDCVYSPYCGICPVVNMSEQKNVFLSELKNYRCEIYGGMLDTIFEFMKNEQYLEIFESWC